MNNINKIWAEQEVKIRKKKRKRTMNRGRNGLSNIGAGGGRLVGLGWRSGGKGNK